MMNSTNNLIASSLPGRLRLRHRALRNSAQLDILHAAVARWRGVITVTANPRAGSLLIQYGPARLAPARIEARTSAAAEKIMGISGSAGVDDKTTATPSRSPGGTPRVFANRWAKRGMLASLAVSLLLAGAGRKRWHWLTGVVFLHALSVHLWVHRRHVLR